MRVRIWSVAATVMVVTVAALPMPAVADTDQQVQATLRALQLAPPMLYPAVLPRRLRDADVTLSTEGPIVVSWDRGTVSASDDNRVGEIGLTRANRSQLREELHVARSRGYRPRQVRVGARKVWRVCGHICGY